MARNRIYPLNELLQRNTKECIFISHQKNDSDKAKAIADYFLNAGIDVYFDEYDPTIKLGDPYSVVNAIRKGIQNSTIMLCLLTENSMGSKWMPWEIGYGYDRTSVVGLTDKDICKAVLPEYLQIVPILKGTKTLNNYISAILRKTESQLIFESRIFSTNRLKHPLDSILERNM